MSKESQNVCFNVHHHQPLAWSLVDWYLQNKTVPTRTKRTTTVCVAVRGENHDSSISPASFPPLEEVRFLLLDAPLRWNRRGFELLLLPSSPCLRWLPLACAADWHPVGSFGGIAPKLLILADCAAYRSSVFQCVRRQNGIITGWTTIGGGEATLQSKPRIEHGRKRDEIHENITSRFCKARLSIEVIQISAQMPKCTSFMWSDMVIT